MEYTTKGTCSRKIAFDVVDNKVTKRTVCHGMPWKHPGSGGVSGRHGYS